MLQLTKLFLLGPPDSSQHIDEETEAQKKQVTLPKTIQQVQGNVGDSTQALPEHKSHNVLKIYFCLLASGVFPWEPDVWALTSQHLRQI